jgi:hypothetical protein
MVTPAPAGPILFLTSSTLYLVVEHFSLNFLTFVESASYNGGLRHFGALRNFSNMFMVILSRV